MNLLYRTLLSSDRDSLMDLILEWESSASSEEEKLALLYARTLSAYYQSDIPQLEKMFRKIDQLKDLSADHMAIYQISKLRLSIRKGNLTLELVDGLCELSSEYQQWRGEIQFVCGFAYSRLGDHYKARKSFLASNLGFKEIGIDKKAVLALHNYIAAEGHLHPEKSMIPDRQMVLKKAIAAGYSEVAGLTTLDLSMDFEAIGAIELALEHARKAVTLLDTHQYTYQHGCALTNLCRLCYKTNCLQEAGEVYAQLKVYEISEIRANLELIEKLREDKEIESSNTDLMPWWLNHFKKNSNKVKLGKLGEELIKLLVDGPRSKNQIIEALYGDDISYESLENRFNVLLSRVRKKSPGLIVLQDDGKYSLRPIDLEKGKL